MESKLKFTQASIVGTPHGNIWSQSFVFEYTLFGVITILGNQESDATIIGKQILVSLQDGYLTLIKSEKRLLSLQEMVRREKEKEDNYKIELLLGFLWQNVLYLVASGNGKIIFKRGDKIIPLLETTPEKDIRSASGFLKENDIVILETSQFGDIISLEKLKECFDGRSLIDVADILAPQIHNNIDQGAAAAIFVSFVKGVVEEKVELEEAPYEIQKSSWQKPPFSFLKNLFSHLLHEITSRLPLKNFSFRPTLHKENKSRLMLRTVAFILLLLLTGSIILNIKSRQAARQKNKVEKTLETARLRFEEGKSLMDLNPVRAQTLLSDAKKTIEETKKTLKKRTKEEENLNKLLSEIEEALNTAARVYKATPQVFFDLTIIKEKAIGSKLSSFQKNLLLLDAENNSVYLLNSQKKSAEIVAGREQGRTLVSLYGKNVYLFHPLKGIIKVDSETKIKREVIKKEDKWGEIIDIFAYAGNLYLLDKKNGQIWKYIATEEGFTEMRSYLTSDTSPDFSAATSFAIDGSVYVLLASGEILKFTQGRIDNFAITGLDQNLRHPSVIFTNDDLKNIYILDKGNKRVIALAKDGTYQAQYQSEIISKAEGLSIDEEAKKIFLLVGSKIYTIDLK